MSVLVGLLQQRTDCREGLMVFNDISLYPHQITVAYSATTVNKL